MSSARHDRLGALFHAALELDGDARSRYLAEACAADPSMRAEVERLLAADAREGLEPSIVAAATARDAPMPARIGEYEVRSVLGRGGMGVVYLAARREPPREVALKVVRASVATPHTLRRFEREARALSRLRHPGIAQIHEAGTFDRGDGPQPYFAMELVDGTPLTEFAEARRLDRSTRLRLLVKLCEAVHHAHEMGVVHRDLKPANVLVDARGEPKVVDFGVARLAEVHSSQVAELTSTGQVVGTLAYMSPEQYAGDAGEIDARSDVYSLGVIAYELLSGRLPHAVAGMPLHRAASIVCEERARPLGELDRSLRGDLETIVAKALEPEKQRRYASASAVAADVERHLARQPILARPASSAYLLRAFARRNKALVGSLAVLFVALIAGVATTSWMYVRASSGAREILVRSSPQQLASLRERADELWPPRPNLIDDYEAWLRDADELVARTAELERRLAAFGADAGVDRERIAPTDDGWVVVDALQRARVEANKRLGHLESDAAAPVDAATRALATRHARAEIERIDADLAAAKLARREPPPRASDGDVGGAERAWRQRLERLVVELRSLAHPRWGLIRGAEPHPDHGWSIATRLELARELRARSAGDAEAWREAIADVATLPIYGGLSLAPQVDLQPIGRDPASGLWEFAHLPSGTAPTRGDDGVLRISDESAVVLVLVPGGEVLHGGGAATNSQRYDPRSRAQRPTRALVDAFLIAKHELTQAQWVRATGVNPSVIWAGSIAGGTPTTYLHPVENVTLLEALRVLGRLGLALPTDAQWERAARADVPDWWDDASSVQRARLANLADASFERWSEAVRAGADLEVDDGYAFHAPVDRFEPNAFGLHQVVGNVFEWVWDRARPDPPAEGGEPLFARSTTHRGGAFLNRASEIGIDALGGLHLNARDSVVGIRPVRAIEP